MHEQLSFASRDTICEGGGKKAANKLNNIIAVNLFQLGSFEVNSRSQFPRFMRFSHGKKQFAQRLRTSGFGLRIISLFFRLFYFVINLLSLITKVLNFFFSKD